MPRGSLGLMLWGAGISALGCWHIATWVQNADAEKDAFKLAVGIFCLLIGVIVIALNLKSRGKGKGN